MKKLIIIICMLITTVSYSQEIILDEIFQFQATSTSTTIWDDSLSDWTDWSDWEDNSILIQIRQPVVGFNSIKIYSRDIQFYTAYSTRDVSHQYTNGELVKWWDTVDTNGNEISIKIINYVNSMDQIIVTHDSFRVAYAIEVLNTNK